MTGTVNAEIHRFFSDYFHAVGAGGPAGILKLVDENFVIKWPVGEPITDREKLRSALAAFQTSVPPRRAMGGA